MQNRGSPISASSIGIFEKKQKYSALYFTTVKYSALFLSTQKGVMFSAMWLKVMSKLTLA